MDRSKSTLLRARDPTKRVSMSFSTPHRTPRASHAASLMHDEVHRSSSTRASVGMGEPQLFVAIPAEAQRPLIEVRACKCVIMCACTCACVGVCMRMPVPCMFECRSCMCACVHVRVLSSVVGFVGLVLGGLL